MTLCRCAMILQRLKDICTALLLYLGGYHVLDILSIGTRFDAGRLDTHADSSKKRIHFIRIISSLYGLLISCRQNWLSISEIHTVTCAFGIFDALLSINKGRYRYRHEYVYLGLLCVTHLFFNYENASVLQVLAMMQIVESMGDVIMEGCAFVSFRGKKLNTYKRTIRQLFMVASLSIQGAMCCAYIWTRTVDWTLFVYIPFVPYMVSKQLSLAVNGHRD